MPISVAGSGAITGTTTINGLTMPTDAIAPGMVLINKTDFNAVSSVSVNNCFSSTYDNYKIMVFYTSISSADASAWVRLRSSGTDNSSSIYYTERITSITSTLAGALDATYTALTVGYLSNTYANFCAHEFTLYSPVLPIRKRLVGQGVSVNSSGNPTHLTFGSYVDSASAFDGMTLLPSAGTVSGTIRIYGYRN